MKSLNSCSPKPGDICKSKNFGDFEVIGEIKEVFDETGLHPLIFKSRASKRYLIRFLDTGYLSYVGNVALSKGEVKDKFRPFIGGVGYLGAEIKTTDPRYYSLYNCWDAMICRCYSQTDANYKDYGALGVNVDPRWFSFWNFYQDAQFILNYDKKIKFPSVYQIDKDILQANVPINQKIYSLQTCMFVSRFDNLQIRSKLIAKSNHKYFGLEYPRTRYEGHVIKRPTYNVRISIYENGKVKTTKCVASFVNEDAAACLYNYIYPFITKDLPFHDLMILNRIENPIPYNELPNYLAIGPTSNWFNDYPDWEYIASAMEAAGDRFIYIYI